MPVAAQHVTGPPELIRVTFDSPLAAGTFLPANFTVRWANYVKAITAAVVAPGPAGILELSLGAGWYQKGPDVVAYLGAPLELVGQNGLTVAPFSDFPIT